MILPTSDLASDPGAIGSDAMLAAHARVGVLMVDTVSSLPIKHLPIAKLDGAGKSGIAFSVAKELGTPISYVGTGEKATDLAEFRPDTYVDSLFFGEGEGF